MKRITLLFAIVLMTFCSLYAQRSPEDIKHENHYAAEPVETNDFKIEFLHAFSTQTLTQVKVKVTNKTKDYLVFKLTESVFKYAHGEFKPESGVLFKVDGMIEPNGSETKTLKITGDNRFHVEELAVDFSGFSKVSTKSETLNAPDFQLPAAKNSFSAGDCDCELVKSKQTTKETSADFKCTYTGKKIAFIDPTQLSVKIKSGQEFANSNKKDKKTMLMPGDDVKFTAVFNIPGKILDMQFAVLNISWNDTFMESNAEPVNGASAKFVFDPELTLLKNK